MLIVRNSWSSVLIRDVCGLHRLRSAIFGLCLFLISSLISEGAPFLCSQGTITVLLVSRLVLPLQHKYLFYWVFSNNCRQTQCGPYCFLGPCLIRMHPSKLQRTKLPSKWLMHVIIFSQSSHADLECFPVAILWQMEQMHSSFSPTVHMEQMTLMTVLL